MPRRGGIQLRDSVMGSLRPARRAAAGSRSRPHQAAADNLAGKGEQLNETLNGLSQALTALNGPGKLRYVREAWRCCRAYQNDQQFVALNLKTLPSSPTGSQIRPACDTVEPSTTFSASGSSW